MALYVRGKQEIDHRYTSLSSAKHARAHRHCKQKTARVLPGRVSEVSVRVCVINLLGGWAAATVNLLGQLAHHLFPAGVRMQAVNTPVADAPSPPLHVGSLPVEKITPP